MFELGNIIQDRYKIQQQLGKKTGRYTLLAYDLQGQELVVIKSLIFSPGFVWDDLKLFEREAEMLKALSHPSIPQYVDFFELDLPPYQGFALVQNYIPAKSLQEQLNAGRTFSEADVKELAKALLLILSYLHGRQPSVIHRDIKPSNILLADRSGNRLGQVYLVDFGSVQTLMTREGSSITVVGTYGYMPPEAFGDRSVPASDLYALGATLIHLCTGTAPVQFLQDLQIRFTEHVELNVNFVRWLEVMTAPAIEQRFRTAHEALVSLEQGINSSTLKSLSSSAYVKSLKLRTELCMSKKTSDELEVRRSSEVKDDELNIICMFLWIGVAIILALVGGIVVSIIIGFLMYIYICCWDITRLNKEKAKKAGKPWGGRIYFNRIDNYFEFSTRWHESSEAMSGNVSKIKYIYLCQSSEMIPTGQHTARRVEGWHVIICVDQKSFKNHKVRLDWRLNEEECIWLIHEIQGWINFTTSLK
jgi:serine/threonine protein kinase